MTLEHRTLSWFPPHANEKKGGKFTIRYTRLPTILSTEFVDKPESKRIKLLAISLYSLGFFNILKKNLKNKHEGKKNIHNLQKGRYTTSR